MNGVNLLVEIWETIEFFIQRATDEGLNLVDTHRLFRGVRYAWTPKLICN